MRVTQEFVSNFCFFLSDKKTGTLALICELLDMNLYELIRGIFTFYYYYSKNLILYTYNYLFAILEACYTW